MIIIDIGTHKAQELRLLRGDRGYIFVSYLKWWIDWLKRLTKIIIRYKGLIQYGPGGYKMSPARTHLSTHWKFIKQFLWPRNYLKDKKVFAIDPAAHITGPYIEKLQTKIDIIYLPIAVLPHDDTDSCKITSFYVAANSLSSSLYADTTTSKQVVCPAFDFSVVMRSLLDFNLISPGTNVALRMNCEGAELAIVQSIQTCDVTLKNIIGSIGDVGKKHGGKAERQMLRILKHENIKFDYFKGSDPSTWLSGFNLLDQSQSSTSSIT